ncbi:hypothetical protein FOD75_11485 (plasmid) [Limosilactobacillus reuteri]|uniref:Uncharacterized protein n=1 Tax=Limosilactobacillus reuteri TaxID=1598 RepID=A0A517D8N2_LIMRT|nr:hypothetical protein [Limosilactobacillus reuteri]QDR73705.1 hypothetical protein FOD75_11485 [Limosilactobacillus reuteri]
METIEGLSEKQNLIYAEVSHLSIWHYLSWDSPLDSLNNDAGLAEVLDTYGYFLDVNPLIPGLNVDVPQVLCNLSGLDFHSLAEVVNELADWKATQTLDQHVDQGSGLSASDLLEVLVATNGSLPMGDVLPLHKLVVAQLAYRDFNAESND